MKTGLIYKITNNVTKHAYIGQTTQGVSTRWKQHINHAKQGKGNAIGRSIRKYGETNFTIAVIVDNVPHYFLDSFEKYWIHFYDTYGKGYNCTAGGLGTYLTIPWNKGKPNCYSETTIAKMRNAKLGKIPTNLAQLAELAKTRVGDKHPNYKAANIYCYTTGTLLHESVCIAEWAKANNHNQGNLAATARGSRLQTCGIYARYI
jgi:group I intron endonuclease